MTKILKENYKRYAISSAITFGTSFLLVLVTELQSLDVESIERSVAFGILFTALRAGIKSLVEYLNGKLE